MKRLFMTMVTALLICAPVLPAQTKGKTTYKWHLNLATKAPGK